MTWWLPEVLETAPTHFTAQVVGRAVRVNRTREPMLVLHAQYAEEYPALAGLKS